MKLLTGLKLYSYPSCSSCRKAISWLNEGNISFDLVNIVEHPPTRAELRTILEHIENRKLVFNTRGISYRNLGSSYINSLPDEKVIELLHDDGKLIKRPLLISHDKGFLIGFKLDNWLDFFRD